MAIGTFPGVMELPVLRICVCWKVGVGVRGGGGGGEFSLLTKAINSGCYTCTE